MALNVEHPAFVKILLSTRVDTAFWTLCSDPRTETPGICAASPRALGARIVRTSGSSWLVYASPSSGTSDEFDLIKEAGSGKRSTITVEGTFSMPFSMTVECLVARSPGGPEHRPAGFFASKRPAARTARYSTNASPISRDVPAVSRFSADAALGGAKLVVL